VGPRDSRKLGISLGLHRRRPYASGMRNYCVVAKDRFTMTVKGESMQVFKDSTPPVLVINAEDKRAVAAFALSEVICVYEQENKP
jgi:hypothetical protein